MAASIANSVSGNFESKGSSFMNDVFLSQFYLLYDFILNLFASFQIFSLVQLIVLLINDFCIIFRNSSYGF